MFEVLGLDTQATTVYKMLLTRSTWDRDQLAAASGLSDDQLRPCLERLATLALVRVSARAPGRLRAVRPEVGLRRLAQKQEDELLARRRAVADSYLGMSRMIAEFAGERPESPSPEAEVLPDADAARARLETLAFQAALSSEAFVPGGAQPPEAVAAARVDVAEALARGVRVRRIYLESAANDAFTRDHLRRLADSGCEIRLVPALPLAMTLVDRRIAVLPISADRDPGAPDSGILVLTSSGALTMLTAYFDRMWAAGRPVGSPVRRPVDGVNAQELELLRVLAQGRTDESAARHLGLSLRTVRRMVADLMERLGARSRFEAGVRAAEHGWLADSDADLDAEAFDPLTPVGA
ncbi:helix-turn-helix domain-containing protein [Catenulispora yoronensis]|uniref:Helix-turn-helix domain-containing protein n=1 Tax=Catenulispora yoronensis TaxID=450799 RepID=A0ABN2V8F6_9ACTN